MQKFYTFIPEYAILFIAKRETTERRLLHMERKNRCAAWLWRGFFYVLGAVVLAVGVALNTKAGLGVSPVISMPYSISAIMGWNFALMTFLIYTLLVCIEMLLKWNIQRQWRDLLQIPFALVFSLFLQFFNDLLDFVRPAALWHSLPILAVAIFLTGAGMALMVNMKLIPNPADGLAQAIGMRAGNRGMGLGKNILDITSVCITCLIGLVLAHKIVGIGVGTLIAMIGVGRSVALVNFLFKKKMQALAHTEDPA